MFSIDFGSKRAKSLLRLATYGVSTFFVVGFTIAVVLATLGYDIDRNTGEVIQNGLVLVNSEPAGAQVTIDDQPERDDTPGRFSVPAGVHTVNINRDNYQQWSKTVSVQGSEVVWLYYPLLIPTEISQEAVTSSKNVEFVSPVPDGQRLLIREKRNAATFRLASLSKTAITNEETLRLPSGIFTEVDDELGSFKFDGWAEGDDYFLIRHKNGSLVEYVLVNVNDPDESINITDEFDLPLRKVRFVNDRFDRLYAVVNGDLRRLNLSDQTISAPLVQQVHKYVLHTDRFVVFLRAADDGTAELGMIEGNDEPRIIQRLPRAVQSYRVEFAAFDDVFHLALLDVETGSLTISFNPHQDSSDSPVRIRQDGAQFVSFSRNGRFVMSQSDKSFALYDFDLERRYSFVTELDVLPDTQVKWLDGHRLVLHEADGTIHLTEFDGANTYRIGTGDTEYEPFISEAQQVIYTVSPASKSGVAIIRGLDLVAEN